MTKVREPHVADAEFVLEHYRRYKDSDGADGHLWDSTGLGDDGLIPTLLLTTRGRKSGEYLEVPLIYGEAEGNYIVVASRGGAPTNPAWYLNLDADPQVQIQVIADRYNATCYTARGAERQALWPLMVSVYPTYAELQTKTTREIPVVVISPQSKISD